MNSGIILFIILYFLIVNVILFTIYTHHFHHVAYIDLDDWGTLNPVEDDTEKVLGDYL